MSPVALVVLVIGQGSADPTATAFERTVRATLGSDSDLRVLRVPDDPADEESEARGADADGVIELGWSELDGKARIHCFVAREQRWVDREISFGTGPSPSDRELRERGRLLGFAVATMFTDFISEPPAETAQADQPQAQPPSPVERPTPTVGLVGTVSASDSSAPSASVEAMARRLDFAGVMSTGLNGTAAGVGAAASLRLWCWGPLWCRVALAGRGGNIPEAQASTRTIVGGLGLAWAALPRRERWELGLRLDVLVQHFAAAHLSEDDDVPDTRARWLPGADLVAEAGLRFAGSAGLFVGAGLEAALGKTEIYTHGRRVAVVPPLRGVGEVGFRVGF